MRSQEGKKKSVMWQEGRKVGSSRCDREEGKVVGMIVGISIPV